MKIKIKTEDNLSLENLGRRLQSNTPPFWKKIRRVSMIIGAIGGGILSIAASGGIALPAVILTAGTVLSSIGAAGAVVASVASDENYLPLDEQ